MAIIQSGADATLLTVDTASHAARVSLYDTGGTSISNTNPLPVTFSGTVTVAGTVAVSNFPGTQAISAASLPLPTGAATAAKQPALGTAGAAATDVLTVQGIASMVALKVDGSAVTQPVSISGTVPVSGTLTANQGTANTAANGWPTKITDGTSIAAVKAASTAAIATDTSLVVALSPNSPIPTGTNSIGSVTASPDVSSTGALGALNAAVTVAMSGRQGVGFQLAGGTFNGTLVPEVSFDGSNWVTSWFYDYRGATGYAQSAVFSSGNGANSWSILTFPGVQEVRVRVSAYTSGTANGTLTAAMAAPAGLNSWSQAPGNAIPAYAVQIAGSDGTNTRVIKTDSGGNISVAQGTAAAVASAWPVKVTDGTNTMPTMDVAARPGFQKITDGTNTMPTMDVAARAGFQKITDGSNTAAVKPASSGAAGTDPSLVVTFSPNSPLPAGTNAIGTVTSVQTDTLTAGTALGALNATVSVALAGQDGAGIAITAISSPTGIVLTPEVSFDGGTNWVAAIFYEVGTGRVFQSLDNTRPAAFAVGQSYAIKVPTGASHARVRVSSWTSGSVTIAMRAAQAGPTLDVTRNQTSTTYSAVFTLAATNAIALSNAFGAAGQKQYATIYHTTAATRKVRIKRVTVTMVSNSVAAVVSAYIQRLTATTAPATGNPAVTPSAHDSSAATAESTCLALPTTAGSVGGTATGIVGAVELNLGVTAGTTTLPIPTEITLYDDSQGENLESLIMRAGVAEGFAVWIGSTAASTVKAIVRMVFVEE